MMLKRKECSKVESTSGAIGTKDTCALAAKDNRSPITGEASLTSSAWKSYPTTASPIRTLCPKSAETSSSGLPKGSNKAVDFEALELNLNPETVRGNRLFHNYPGARILRQR